MWHGSSWGGEGAEGWCCEGQFGGAEVLGCVLEAFVQQRRGEGMVAEGANDGRARGADMGVGRGGDKTRLLGAALVTASPGGEQVWAIKRWSGCPSLKG